MTSKTISNQLQRFVCDNCGFWQIHNTFPSTCAVCTDFRHTPPARAFGFLSIEEAARALTSTWSEVAPQIWEIRAEPPFGIPTVAYFLEHEAGNVLWDGAAYYSPQVLGWMRGRGGLRWLAASHPHAFGAAWQIQQEFEPVVAAQVLDLSWTGAFEVSWPFDEKLELAPGLEILHTGGHFDGHSVLFWRKPRALFAGDMLKFHFDSGLTGISCHKAFNRGVPISHEEARKYRDVVCDLDFETVYTSFDHAPCTQLQAVALFEAQLAGKPFFGPIPMPT